jgi:hypothetical protein
MTRPRSKTVELITQHVSSEQDMTDDGVELVYALVFALCWSEETHELAERQMQPVVELNEREQQAHRNWGSL